MRWHLVSGEYPPSCGGVGDYTEQLASALASAGDEVEVWVPSVAPRDGAVRVHTLPDVFGPRSRGILAEAWMRAPGIVLLQYVPNAFGARGANLSFCRWLLTERRAGMDVRVMFHEPYFYFSMRRPWRNALAVIQRRMAGTLIRASTHVYYSSERWNEFLQPYGAGSDALALPIPSTIPSNPAPAAVAGFRARFSNSGTPVVGHFGTFGEDMTRALVPVATTLIDTIPNVPFAFIGERSDQFERAVVASRPAAGPRCRSTGRLSAAEVSAALCACDVLIQPYPEGVTTRRTTVMAGLRNEVATVTTDGALTERTWRETGAAVLARAGDPQAIVAAAGALLTDATERRRQGRRGAETYAGCFSIEQTTLKLRRSVGAEMPVPQ